MTTTKTMAFMLGTMMCSTLFVGSGEAFSLRKFFDEGQKFAQAKSFFSPRTQKKPLTKKDISYPTAYQYYPTSFDIQKMRPASPTKLRIDSPANFRHVASVSLSDLTKGMAALETQALSQGRQASENEKNWLMEMNFNLAISPSTQDIAPQKATSLPDLEKTKSLDQAVQTPTKVSSRNSLEELDKILADLIQYAGIELPQQTIPVTPPPLDRTGVAALGAQFENASRSEIYPACEGAHRENSKRSI